MYVNLHKKDQQFNNDNYSTSSTKKSKTIVNLSS